MLIFCTLFNSVYLSRGMAMYQSLCDHCDDFHLYVFAFDNATYEFFAREKLPHITPVSLAEFEDEELLRVKPTRTAGEYCWTCSSSTIYWVLNHYNVEHCTYIDADLFFYSNPKVLVDEMGANSVLITEHRYTPCYDQTETSGRYCVQFVTVKNDKRGREVITWWRERCLEWCYNRMEDGKFGDQKYLDDWTERFDGIHVLQHLGGGVAPWNMQQYTYELCNGRVYGKEKKSGTLFPLVFFHFHNLNFVSPRRFTPGWSYAMPEKEAFLVLFKPCISAIKQVRARYPFIASCERYFTFRQKRHDFRDLRKHHGLSRLLFYWFNA